MHRAHEEGARGRTGQEVRLNTPSPVTRTDIAAWIIAAVALALVIELHLLSALLAGLLVFKLVDVLTPWLRLRALGRDGPRILAVTLIASAVIAALIGIGIGIVAFVRNSGESVPQLMQSMAQIIEDARAILPEGLRSYVPEDSETLRVTIAEWLRSNAGSLQLAGRGIGRSLAHILLGMVIGALLSMQKASTHPQRRPLTEEIARHAARMASVVPARGVRAVLDLADQHLLHLAVPRRGAAPVRCRPATGEDPGGTDLRRWDCCPSSATCISNTAIVIVCLSQGVPVALASLVYLVVIHKLEYFLNARIIGSHINARAWELLIAMLVMEAAFGITGLIAAPIFYAYFKAELREKGLI